MNRQPLLAFAALALCLAACASEPEPRFTLQAGAIAKSDLDGVWYFRQTVVDVPFTTGFTFIGEQGENELEKIRWDIQENVITARRAFEYVRGTEKEYVPEGSPYLGAPVAAWKITSHFDVVRDYNASTGEEYDKIVENTERKWYERKFLRVDWATNLISNFEFLADFDHGGISAIRQDPAPYYVSDPKDPDALRVERTFPSDPASYIEVTQKLVASPESVDFEDETNVPLCWLEYATQDCASQEIKLRNSFMRADEGDRDYDPLVYKDTMMDRFGYFTTERKTYNRQYGTTESGQVKLTNRFNMWRKSLSDKRCTTDDQCAPLSSGVHCALDLPSTTIDDSGALVGRCSLPYAERNGTDGPRQIVYYLNEGFPEELRAEAAKIFDEYDETFRGIYKTLTGQDSPTKIFVLCQNNPVLATDPRECGVVGTHARIGDLRYNMLYWVDQPNSAQLMGYGPSSHDPETGETVEATAFIYGAAIDSYAAMSRDLVRLVNGEIAPDQYVSGVDIEGWINQHQAGQKARTLTQADVDDKAAQMDFSWTAGLPHSPALHPASAKKLAEMMRVRSKALAGTQTLGAEPGLAQRRLARLTDTDVERQMVTGEVMLARGMDPRTPSQQIDAKSVRPLSWINPETSRFIRRERRRLGAKGVDIAETLDDAVIGFAMAQQGKDPQDIWRIIRKAVFRSTAEHEIGHTLGLRHNFAGSFDAMNYPNEYWDLRLADGAPRPRYLDPETPAEQQGFTTADGLQAGISEFQTSSVMDYGAKFNSDIQGLGRYDRAALKFGYGQLVEVFNDVTDPYLLGALQATITFGYPQPLLVDCAGNDYISVHYTKFPYLATLDDREDIEFSKVEHSPVVDNCAEPDSVDHDADGRLVVPYRFCSDEFEGASPECNMFDRGADVYEIARNSIDTYKNYYIFNNFKRDRLGFNPEGYLDRIQWRYLEPLRNQMQFYALFRADLADAAPDDGSPNNFWHSPDAWGPFTVAVADGFDLLGEILTAPEPGMYYVYDRPDGTQAYFVDNYQFDAPDFELAVPEGRYFTTEWDYDSGYFWYERISHIGTFVDKVAALAQMTDPETYFLGADQAADLRQYAINYWRVYPKQMQNIWGAMLTEDWDAYAPLWTGTEIKKRPWSKTLTASGINDLAIDPHVDFTVELYAAALGMSLIPATFDQTFVDSSRIFLAGSGYQLVTSLPTITFDDPLSGKRYVAVSYEVGGNETGIGARMLLRAEDLAAMYTPGDAASEATLRNYIQILDVQRSLTETFYGYTY